MQKDPFRIAYDEHVDFVWRLLRYFRVPADERHDAAQEVFVALSENLHKLEPGAVKPYLYGIANHVAAKRRRWAGRFFRFLTACTSASSDTERPLDPEQASARNAELERFYRLLDGLDEVKREVFILIEIESMTIEEVAMHTDTKPNTVSSRLRLARKELQRALSRELVKESWRYRWTI